MLSARLGHFLDKPLRPFLKYVPFSPNTLSVAGFIFTVAAALVIQQSLKIGGVLLMIGGLCDMLDGMVARTTGQATKFGAFLDSVLDRYSDAALFLSLAWYLGGKGDHYGALISLGTLAGAFLVSYARARAEGVGIPCHTGLMERPERIILVLVALFSGYIVPILWLMFVLTHVTVVQRIYHVWKSLRH